jgi:hypothetical protein
LPEIAKANQLMNEQIASADNPDAFRREHYDIEYCSDSDGTSSNESDVDDYNSSDDASSSTTLMTTDSSVDTKHDGSDGQIVEEEQEEEEEEEVKISGKGGRYIKLKLGVGVFDVLEPNENNSENVTICTAANDEQLLDAIRRNRDD